MRRNTPFPSPFPSQVQTSSARPIGVTHTQSMLPSLKVILTGLVFFSLTIRDTRSMTDISSPLSTLSSYLKLSGIERR